MKKSAFWARVLLGTPGLVMAQLSPAPAPPSPANPADPLATVPSVVYQSVFADTPTGVEMQSIDWKKANAEVGQFRRGHVDVLKWEETQGGITPTSPKQTSPQAGHPQHQAKP